MSPLEFDILSHIYCTPGKYEHQYKSLWLEITEKFINMGVIERYDTENGYTVTSLGRAWVKDILSTPIPKLAYIRNDGTIIDMK